MSSSDLKAKPPMAAGLKLLLVLSLTANLVVAGLFAGAALNQGRDSSPGTAMSDIGIAPFVSALPQEVRREMGRDLVARSGSLRENRRMLQEQFDEMLGLLRAETFDLDRLREITSAQDQKLRERQDLGRELLFARLATMSPADRAAYADRLENRLKRGQKTWPEPRRGEPRRDPPPATP